MEEKLYRIIYTVYPYLCFEILSYEIIEKMDDEIKIKNIDWGTGTISVSHLHLDEFGKYNNYEEENYYQLYSLDLKKGLSIFKDGLNEVIKQHGDVIDEIDKLIKDMQ